jgi:uncharacterized RDD family membrane protein YckC
MNEDTSQSSGNTTIPTVRVIGFGRRLVAIAIDALIVTFFSAILIGIFSILSVIVVSYSPHDDPIIFTTIFSICGVLVSIIYFVRFWVKSEGQTMGKGMMGIQIISTDGSSISWGKGLIRYIGYIISGLVFSLGFIWVAFDGKRQGWHDKMAGTYVIDADTNSAMNAKEVNFIQSDPGQGWIWVVLWVIIALIAPPALWSSLFFLGPAVSRMIAGMF